MVNLLSTYNNYQIEHDNFYLLGHKTPHKITDLTHAELTDLFLYTYSYLGISLLEFFTIDKLKNICIYELDNLILKDKSLNQYHKWWFLTLTYFRLGAEIHNIRFLMTLCDTLIDNLSNLTEKELVSYCNILNDSLSEIIGMDLRIRPSLDKNPNVYIYPIYRDLTLNSKKIISIFKKHLCIDEIQNEDINHEFALISKLGYNYNKWSVIFDFLIGQILTQIDKPSVTTNHSDNLINAIDLSLLNLYIDTDYIPENLTIVRDEIIGTLNK